MLLWGLEFTVSGFSVESFRLFRCFRKASDSTIIEKA